MNLALELSEQLDWYWTNAFRPRLAGLSDEEYLWEPVDGCWSVRPIAGGKFMADYPWPEPSPPPVTTIGWRMAHIAGPILAWRNSSHFGGPSFDIQTFEWPGAVRHALDLLDGGYARWKAGVEALDAAALAGKAGVSEGPYAEYSLAALVLHINREIIHHGAELALLRDLYRATSGRLSR